MESLKAAVKNYNATVDVVLRALKRIPSRVNSSIIHVPGDFSTISAAVTAASAGDTILVQRGVYRESVTIPSSKRHLRIIANGTPVVLDGGKNLGVGFNLMADHVEIQGFAIRNFKRAGIRVASVLGSRIISNRIRNIAPGNGIEMNSPRIPNEQGRPPIDVAFGTLVYNNTVTLCRMAGIDVRGTNTWVVGNVFRRNRMRGIHVRSFGNHVVNNRIHANGLVGVLDSSGNNSILNNVITENGRGIFSERRFGGSVILSNTVSRNHKEGILLNTGRHIVADNLAEGNTLSGVYVRGAFDVVEQNKIIENQRNGLILTKRAHGSLVLRNRLRRNLWFGIKLVNLNSSVIENRCRKSAPAGLCTKDSNGVNVIHVPGDFRTISAAVAAAKTGDTILVKDGIYHERVVIPLRKSAMRIIADGENVILDGKSTLGAAFIIRGANNVEIHGFTIRNYVNTGIRVTSIDSKLISNRIENITQGNGISLRRAFSTLIWKNSITKAKLNGIRMAAKNTWIIDNDLKQNRQSAICTFENTTWGSAIIGNRIQNNAADGIDDGAGFNLIFNNDIRNNQRNGVHQHGDAGFVGVIGNVIVGNFKNGVRLSTNGSFVTNGIIRKNRRSGIRMEGDANTLEKNTILSNDHYGILRTVKANGNLILRNRLVGNTLANMKMNNLNNTLIQNRRNEGETTQENANAPTGLPPGVTYNPAVQPLVKLTASTSEKQQAILAIARSKIDTPLIWAHNHDRGQPGFDCSNYVAYVFHHALGYKFTSYSKVQYWRVGTPVSKKGTPVPLSMLQIGDILCFENGEHVGIYAGDGRMIQCGGGIKKVGYLSVEPDSYWGKRLCGAKRLID